MKALQAVGLGIALMLAGMAMAMPLGIVLVVAGLTLLLSEGMLDRMEEQTKPPSPPS